MPVHYLWGLRLQPTAATDATMDKTVEAVAEDVIGICIFQERERLSFEYPFWERESD